MAEIPLRIGFFADFHIFCRALTHVSREVSRFEIGRFKKKLWPLEDTPFSRFLIAHSWEEPFSHLYLKTWPEWADLAEILIFFTKKVPDNIATSKLKIGRT